MRKKYRIIKVNRYKDYETGCLEDYSVYNLTYKGTGNFTFGAPSISRIELRILAIEEIYG